jgi:hypothetical protein
MESIFINYGLLQVLGTPLKVPYVMVIQKLSMIFIQYYYIIYNIVVLNPFLF